MLAVSVQYMQAKEQQRHNMNTEIQAINELEQKKKELQFQKDKFVQEHELNLIMSQYSVASKIKELQIQEANAKVNIAKAESDFLKAQAAVTSANASLVSAQAAAANAAINAKSLAYEMEVKYPTNVQLQQQANRTNILSSIVSGLGRVGAAIVSSTSKAAKSGENAKLATQNNWHFTQNLIENQNRFYN